MSGKQIFGNAMIAAPFVGIFALSVWAAGVLFAVTLFGGVALLVAWMAVAVWLSEP